MHISSPAYLGLDIAKLTLDFSPLTSPKGHAFTNDPAGHRRLIKFIRSAAIPSQLILEASGGATSGANPFHAYIRNSAAPNIIRIPSFAGRPGSCCAP